MADYIGETCAVCAKTFQQDDDIVVCPDCGTPYHRACWAKVGQCLHASEHEAGFVWQPVVHSRDYSDRSVICPNCGTRNSPDAKNCAHCGVPLSNIPPDSQNKPIYARERSPYENPEQRQQSPGNDSQDPRLLAYTAGRDGEIFRRELGPDDTIDGIKARDWSRYVGASSPFYLTQFFRMSLTKRRIAVCFSAFLLGPIYFFYRKMWAEGIRFALLLLALEIPSVLSLLASAGMAPFSGWNLTWLGDAVQVCYIASWAVRVLMGMFAIYWYKQSAASNIRKIYAKIPEGPDRTDALTVTGGTSLIAVLLYIVAYFALASVLAFVLGPYLQTVLNSILP